MLISVQKIAAQIPVSQMNAYRPQDLPLPISVRVSSCTCYHIFKIRMQLLVLIFVGVRLCLQTFCQFKR